MPWHWVNYNINISLKHKYVYFENPKVACSSIKKTLINYELGELSNRWGNVIHQPLFHSAFVKPYQLKEETFWEIINDPKYLKFSFVRSPYSRALSCYLQKIKTKASGYEQIKPFLTDSEIVSNISFQRFLEIVDEMDCYDMNSHFRPQTQQLFFKQINLGFIGKLENFNQDFANVLSKISGEDEPPITHIFSAHQTNACSKLDGYLTPEIIDLINRIYSDDFTHYGYQKMISSK